MARQDRIGTHRTTVRTDEHGDTVVTYHSTPVVTFNRERAILRNGGWFSNTTKTRINQTARQFNLPFAVVQRAFNWYIETPQGDSIAFKEGIQIPLK